MQTVVAQRTEINASAIYAMRHSGATLQHIADKIGKTKERVRQILVKNYGSTKRKLISTEQLRKLAGLPRNRIIEFYLANIIIPVREWDTDGGRYLLWSPASLEQINIYYETHRLCKICHSSIPKGRLVYCSEQCYNKSRKYKYKSIETKQRHLRSIRRYREKCKQIAQAAVIGDSKQQPMPSAVIETAIAQREE